MSEPIHPYDCTPFPVGEFLPNGQHNDPPYKPNDITTGFRLNHFMLRIRDPKKSLKFYIEIMGMRTVFTMNTGPFTIYYLGFPQTPEHKEDFSKFSNDTLPVMQHTLGLLELYHLHGSEKQEEGYYSTGNAPPALGFGHLGFTVPNVPAALERMKQYGVPIVKDLGVSQRSSIPLTDYEKERGIGLGGLHENYSKIFRQIAFVQDPDGYYVELVPQDMKD